MALHAPAISTTVLEWLATGTRKAGQLRLAAPNTPTYGQDNADYRSNYGTLSQNKKQDLLSLPYALRLDLLGPTTLNKPRHRRTNPPDHRGLTFLLILVGISRVHSRLRRSRGHSALGLAGT